MLELQSISWQNFLSYGDYVTTLNLDKLGQCLIVGEVVDSDTTAGQARRSNGAGKSTIPSVIQWALFGRTMHSRSPGNNVVNWFTGQDCWATITFKNGDSITRTRNTDGKNELLINRNGDETKFISDTLSTSTLQQQQLNKIFGLDWEVFCGSVFFNQYGKPWMEMADATRKKAIERILHVDRLTYYSQAAKSRCDNLDKLVSKNNQMLEIANNGLIRLNQELERLKTAADTFSADKKKRHEDWLRLADEEIMKRDAIDLPDIDKLQTKWDLINKIQDKLHTLKSKRDDINSKISNVSGNIQNLESIISRWKQKSGKLCPSCEQSIPSDHISSKIEPVVEDLDAKNRILKELENDKERINSTIKEAENIINDKKPTMTIEKAKNIHWVYNQHNLDSAKYKKKAESVLIESNPHDKSIADVLLRIEKTERDIKITKEELERSELLNKHYHYIHKVYNDRTKIKSFIFKDHIPFINSRLKYYLEVFNLDIKIELTEALGVTSSMWGYEFESGGERKRTDVAFMLAMFDFHEQMYGRQCNMLVLDEVDGRLDDDGIDSLINIIKNDLTNRVETILIISHRNLMHDVFPNEIKVVRRDRFSTLEK